MSRKNPLLEQFEYAFYMLVTRAARRISDERLARWGTRFGNAARHTLRGRDRLAFRNLRKAFPERSEADLRRVLDESWRHFGREILSFVRAQTLSEKEIAEHCPFVNAHLLEEARSYGNGVVILSAHFGGWEIGGLAIMSLLDNVLTVARPLDNRYLERDLSAARARTGARVVDRRRAARPLLKALDENAVVVLLPDQAVQPKEGVLVPFLGSPAWTTDGPAKMALRAGSAIVFAFCIPVGTRHQLEFQDLIRTDQLSEAQRDPIALTAHINDVISRRIASRPELWLWMHDRWKGTGENEQP